MTGFSIQAYEDKYKEEIIDLILTIQQQEYHIPITKEDQPDLSDIPAVYQQGLGNFWVAVQAGAVIGTIALIDLGNQQVALRKMFVKAEQRGGKPSVSKALLEGLVDWARQQKIKEIYLGTTAQFLAAHRFYEKNQFVLIDKEQLPASFPVMKVDSRFYQRIL